MKKNGFTPYKPPSRAVARNRRILKLIVILMGAMVLFAIGWFATGTHISKTQSVNHPIPNAGQAQAPDYGPLIGQWQRSDDNGQLLQINGVGTDGRIDCAYSNPHPVDVAHAETITKGDTIELFLELKDKGYPVAAYQLLYHPDRKILTGLYYQRADGIRYGVTFTRKK